ncbi:MAG: RNA-binding protein [Cenarchaeum symbiont of Oopsacas minuta]|nr:RNA-binding protein [Cenarchaeum symbiont of Oopsacas minuta]
MQRSVIDQLKRKQIIELLEQDKRIDGRSLEEQRKLVLETNVIPKANGSARVLLGKTHVVSGVKIQPDRPFPDTGDRGVFICTAEILPIAHHTAEPGPPNETVIELARVVDRGIRESKAIDITKLVIKKDVSVVGVFADNSVIDHDGNLFDACSYASTCAILSSNMPKWEMVDDRPQLVKGTSELTPVQTIPVSITMARIKDHILVDPNGDEWESMDARVTITTNSDGNICAMQKGGTGGFTQKQLELCADTSIKVGTRVRDMIRTTTGRNDI